MKPVKRSNGLDTALYKKYTSPLLPPIIRSSSFLDLLTPPLYLHLCFRHPLARIPIALIVTSSYFISISLIALLIVRICPISLLPKLLLLQFFLPASVYKFSYNPSTVSAFILATTLFPVDRANFYSDLSFSEHDSIHSSGMSLFFFTAFSASSFTNFLVLPCSSLLICHMLPCH